MEYVKRFREPEVYKAARQLSKKILEMFQKFPGEEMYSMTDQIRRSSRSIGAQIAEAWGKRKYERHFISKLTDSDAEQLETQHWIETALSCSYISKEEADTLLTECIIIGKMLNSMIQKSDSFCKPASTHEPIIDYDLH
ncbi:MAG: four helix bundle protein [Marivirga sp.]|nr:four helix bundle protein [Marivirga sp.]